MPLLAYLIGLLFPAIKSALLKAETTKAQVHIKFGDRIQILLHGIRSLAGNWLGIESVVYRGHEFRRTLARSKRHWYLNQPTEPPFGLPFNLTTSTLQGNPRGIHFLDFKQADLDATGAFVDPWKRPYLLPLDVSFAGSVGDPICRGRRK